MNLQIQALIGGVIRHALTFVGGGVSANGLATGSEIEAIAGAVTTIIGFVWSLYNKKNK